MALERLAGTDGYPGNKATSEVVRQMVLNSRVFSAERFKDPALDLVCTAPSASQDVVAACATLRAWDNRGSTSARGSHVWDEFWSRVQVPAAQLYAVPFDPADPLNTPRGLQPGAADALRQAFGAAVQAVKASGFALDAPRGDVLFSARGGVRTALYGGCSAVGYFTINCSENPIGQGGYSMDGQPHGNSYMQVVNFPAGGVQAYTFLTFSLSDDPGSAHYADYTRAYGAQQWLRVPFAEAEITADKHYQTVTVSE
jgi:acyl-homoserine-lactone acylase